MTRYGCVECGEVMRKGGVFKACTYLGADDECPAPIIELPATADVLAFKLHIQNREQEAERIELDAASMREHRP